MKNQFMILLLVSAVLLVIFPSHSADQTGFKDVRSDRLSISSSPLRELPTHDVMLSPLTPLMQAKAISLEAFYDKQKERRDSEVALKNDEDEQLREAIRLSLAESSSPMGSPSAINLPMDHSPDKKNDSPYGMPRASAQPDELSADLDEAIKLSLRTEAMARNKRQRLDLDEQKQYIIALQESTYEERSKLEKEVRELEDSLTSSHNSDSSSPSVAQSGDKTAEIKAQIATIRVKLQEIAEIRNVMFDRLTVIHEQTIDLIREMTMIALGHYIPSSDSPEGARDNAPHSNLMPLIHSQSLIIPKSGANPPSTEKKE